MRWALAVLALAVGCSAPVPRRAASRDAAVPRRAMSQEAPAPRRAASDAAPLAEASCAGCHARELAGWSESMHHASFTSPDFQRSLRAERRPDCVACHAPLGAPELGIGCTACHGVTAAHVGPGRARATTHACESCHDFDAPGTRAVLQATGREHAASRAAGTACATCHVRGGDHAFRVSRDPAFLARAVRLGAPRFTGDAIELAIASEGVGHRFPTGDLYRRLTVTVTARAAGSDALVAGESFHFARDWDRHRASLHEAAAEPVLDDGRLGDAPRTLRMPCPTRPARVHVTVVYTRGIGARGEDLEAFEELVLRDEDLALAP